VRNTTLHDERDLLQYLNVVKWVVVGGNNVGSHSDIEAADFIIETQ